MYNSIRMFYANGGGACYIFAVNTYGDAADIEVNLGDFTDPRMFDQLEKEYEPTLVVMPDLIELGAEAYNAYALVLAHCEKVQSRFAILDLAQRTQDNSDAMDLVVTEFREQIGINALKYGAAYYPWLKTSIVQSSEVSLDNMVITPNIETFLPEKDAQNAIAKFKREYNPGAYSRLFVDSDAELNKKGKDYDDALAAFTKDAKPATETALNSALKAFNDYALTLPPISAQSIADTKAKAKENLVAAQKAFDAADDAGKAKAKPALDAAIDRLKAIEGATPYQVKDSYYKALKAVSPTYVALLDKVRGKLNEVPPSGAMAGIYSMVDSTRGVWKAPANVSVAMVSEPSVNVSHVEQEKLNVDVIAGKSINVIRAFPGIGTLVWGGSTLDGNSLDWRYINVRRTLIMIEQSLKLATRAYVFEPNDANTWVTVKSMIINFLTNLWKQGALAGAAPEQAFDVQIGLGATMTPTDVLEGKMLISVKVAVVRPAEFIVITFEQQLQQS
ncbi:MAG: phage tail sheath family protein [Pyrinomonadaceae bacterium]|nr:phage tail sheath family protein [Sphingobacteriaceae bacterium]